MAASLTALAHSLSHSFFSTTQSSIDRIIVLTGELAVLAKDSSLNMTYSGASGGQDAYCNAKVGVNWMFQEMHKRNPGLWMNLVHPGVIANDLAGE